MHNILRRFLLISFCLLFFETKGQQIIDISNFFTPKDTKNVLVIGEVHTSSASVQVITNLVEQAKKHDLPTTLFIEGGTSSAFLLNLYLDTGDEKLLNNFFLASFKEWINFWKNQHNNLVSSNSAFSLKIVGYDFERLAPLLSALKYIEDQHHDIHHLYHEQIEILRDHLENRTKGKYPSGFEEKLVSKIKETLRSILHQLQQTLTTNELEFIKKLLNNPVKGFAGNRETQLFTHSLRLLNDFEDSNRILITGEGHADYSQKNFIYQLNKTEIKITNTLILLNNSDFWPNNYQKTKTKQLKKPWTKYSQFNIVQKGFKLIDLKKIDKLSMKADFTIVATGQKALTLKGT